MRHNNIVMDLILWENTIWVRPDRFFLSARITVASLLGTSSCFCTQPDPADSESALTFCFTKVRMGKTCDLGNFEHDMIADAGRGSSQ